MKRKLTLTIPGVGTLQLQEIHEAQAAMSETQKQRMWEAMKQRLLDGDIYMPVSFPHSYSSLYWPGTKCIHGCDWSKAFCTLCKDGVPQLFPECGCGHAYCWNCSKGKPPAPPAYVPQPERCHVSADPDGGIYVMMAGSSRTLDLPTALELKRKLEAVLAPPADSICVWR